MSERPARTIKFASDSRLVYQPRYVDDARTRIRAIVRQPDGQLTEVEASTSDTRSPVIRDTFLQYTPEDLELFTEHAAAVAAEKARTEKRAAEDRARNAELEMTFIAKARALELDEVKSCRDPRVARRIRRAKSSFEVAAWVTTALRLSLEQPDTEPETAD